MNPLPVKFASSIVRLARANRPFYRYGDHIELIRFKEYYRMPRGHEQISFVFSSAFRDLRLNLLLTADVKQRNQNIRNNEPNPDNSP